jgi:hypothetical protein
VTHGEARRIATNIAKLPELLKRTFAEASFLGRPALLVAPAQSIEKILHRHVERQRKLIKRAGRYTIDGPFVFLQLLERNAERVGKRGLAQARFQPPQAQPRSNVAIDRVRKTVRHYSPIGLIHRQNFGAASKLYHAAPTGEKGPTPKRGSQSQKGLALCNMTSSLLPAQSGVA